MGWTYAALIYASAHSSSALFPCLPAKGEPGGIRLILEPGVLGDGRPDMVSVFTRVSEEEEGEEEPSDS